MFLVLLREMRMLSESKNLIVHFWCKRREGNGAGMSMLGYSEFKIYLCNPRMVVSSTPDLLRVGWCS